MVVKNKKKVFSGGRLGVYALLVALGVTGAVVGLDKDKKSEKAGTENAVLSSDLIPTVFSVQRDIMNGSIPVQILRGSHVLIPQNFMEQKH